MRRALLTAHLFMKHILYMHNTISSRCLYKYHSQLLLSAFTAREVVDGPYIRKKGV